MDDVNINRAVHKVLGNSDCEHHEISGKSGIWTCVECGVTDNLDSDGTEYDPFTIPDYSIDLNAAMKFAENLIADGWDIDITNEDALLGGWCAELYNGEMIGGRLKYYTATELSLAKAICLAGLSALGAEPKSQPDRRDGSTEPARK
jgi:hypothetical protein